MDETALNSALDDSDIDEIERALTATDRGRRFLIAFAERNRAAETQAILDALAGVETRIVATCGQPPEFERIRNALGEMRAEIAATKTEVGQHDPASLAMASNELDSIVHATEKATTDILSAAEKVQELAWTMREMGADAQLCEQLDDHATAIYMACSFQDLTGQRTARVVDTLRFIDGRLNTLIDMWGTATTDEADVQVAEPATPPDPNAADDILETDDIVAVDFAPVEAVDGESGDEGEIDWQRPLPETGFARVVPDEPGDQDETALDQEPDAVPGGAEAVASAAAVPGLLAAFGWDRHTPELDVDFTADEEPQENDPESQSDIPEAPSAPEPDQSVADSATPAGSEMEAEFGSVDDAAGEDDAVAGDDAAVPEEPAQAFEAEAPVDEGFEAAEDTPLEQFAAEDSVPESGPDAAMPEDAVAPVDDAPAHHEASYEPDWTELAAGNPQSSDQEFPSGPEMAAAEAIDEPEAAEPEEAVPDEVDFAADDSLPGTDETATEPEVALDSGEEPEDMVLEAVSLDADDAEPAVEDPDTDTDGEPDAVQMPGMVSEFAFFDDVVDVADAGTEEEPALAVADETSEADADEDDDEPEAFVREPVIPDFTDAAAAAELAAAIEASILGLTSREPDVAGEEPADDSEEDTEPEQAEDEGDTVAFEVFGAAAPDDAKVPEPEPVADLDDEDSQASADDENASSEVNGAEPDLSLDEDALDQAMVEIADEPADEPEDEQTDDERALLAAEAHAAEDMPATGDARPGDPLVVDSDMIARVEDTLSEMEPQGRDSFIKLSLSAVNRWSNGRKIAIFS